MGVEDERDTKFSKGKKAWNENLSEKLVFLEQFFMATKQGNSAS